IGDPIQINGYSYSENNPVTFADPTGLMSAAQGGGGGGGGYNGDQYGGPSKGELAWAQAEQNRSMSSVIADAGWSLLKGLIGYDDMIACFSRGDLWACGRMIIDALPWTKVFSAAKKVWNAVSRISGAISAFKKAQEKARQIIEMARKAQEAARKAAEAKKKAAEKAAQLKKKAEQAKLRAAKQAAQKTGNAVQKAKKAAAKKAEKPINRARQQAKKEDAPAKSGKSGSRSGGSSDSRGGSRGEKSSESSSGRSSDSALQSRNRAGSGPRMPMTMECVCQVASKYNIDISGIKIKIDKSRAGYYGSTAPDQSITLTRDAFRSEEQLARTLAHERFHVDQIRNGMGYPKEYDAANAWEDAATNFENWWWDNMGKGLK
ncbi:hypothetical protein ACWDR0_34800, partial [Streptomyces sp. NPDC003691]